MVETATETAVIEVEELRKKYAAGGQWRVVLDGLDLTLRRGESVAVMGPSGSGKSTLLHILGTLDTPTAGRVRLAGREASALTPREAADFRNRTVGFIFQDHQLLPQCTTLENVLIPALAAPGGARARLGRATELLERLGLAELADQRPGVLSGGERQRVAIARALINQPQILLCDEPTGNLDQALGESIGRLLAELQRSERVALVVVTHNGEFAAHFDRVLRLREGRLHA